jgi:hypothetical protein
MPVPPNARRDAFMLERGDGRRIHVLGDEVTIKISSRDTGGAFAVLEGRTRPLHGPPLHLHRDQDESWYVVEPAANMEVGPLRQNASFDHRLARNHPPRRFIGPEKPGRTAVGEYGPAASARGPSARGEEAPPTAECIRSLSVGLAVARLA